MESSASTELNRPREPRAHDATSAHGPPLSQAWITDELIEKHQRVWSRRYQREITREEAIEIIVNIKRFAEAVLKIDRDQST